MLASVKKKKFICFAKRREKIGGKWGKSNKNTGASGKGRGAEFVGEPFGSVFYDESASFCCSIMDSLL